MISVDQTLKTLLSLVSSPTEPETIDLQDSLARILAKPIISLLDFPEADNSAMDGYAVRHGDVGSASPDCPVNLTVIEEIPAEKIPQNALQHGQAARIFTGGTLPQGADTIVIQENTERNGNGVTVLAPSPPGEFIRRRGSYCRQGDLLLDQGTSIGPPEIAILAAAQCLTVPVWQRPRVAILATGSELIAPQEPRQPGKIVDSNQVAIAAFVRQSGGIPHCLGIVKDNPDLLEAKITSVFDHMDLIITTGGASVGAYDYVTAVLANLQANIPIRSVAIKPGKPLTVATFPGTKTVLIGLPGNPASALVGCWRFIYFVLQKMSGLPSSSWQPTYLTVTTDQDLLGTQKRETYLWGRLEAIGGHLRFVMAVGSQNSGNLIGLAYTNALAIVPLGVELIKSGALVQVIPILAK